MLPVVCRRLHPRQSLSAKCQNSNAHRSKDGDCIRFFLLQLPRFRCCKFIEFMKCT